MPLLERFACPAGAAVGFVVPLFSQHPGANLCQVQVLDGFWRIGGFEDITREPRLEREAELACDRQSRRSSDLGIS